MPASTAKKEMEVVSLPDYSSLEETTAFALYLKDNIERYGVKTLLYHTEMIEGHLKRIAIHTEGAQKILVRVNGDITTTQKNFYTLRVAKTIARKFYTSLSDKALDSEAELQGIDFRIYDTRERIIERLVEVYVETTVKPYCEGE